MFLIKLFFILEKIVYLVWKNAGMLVKTKLLTAIYFHNFIIIKI